MPKPPDSFFYGATLLVVKALARAFFSFSASRTIGRENIPAGGGFVLASNHASYLDPPILAVASPRQLTYIAKQELFRNPLFAAVITRLGARPIERGTGDREALQTAIGLLAAGHGVVVFPEGTRTTTGRMGKMKSGAVLLAAEAGVPIIPAYIRGSFEAWPKGGRVRRARVTVAFDRPIRSEEFHGSRKLKAMKLALVECLNSMEAHHGRFDKQ